MIQASKASLNVFCIKDTAVLMEDETNGMRRGWITPATFSNTGTNEG
jgi:hypothetical protein